jgi:hypothetical protein
MQLLNIVIKLLENILEIPIKLVPAIRLFFIESKKNSNPTTITKL